MLFENFISIIMSIGVQFYKCRMYCLLNWIFFVNLKVDVIVNSVGQDLVMIFGFCFVIVVVVGFNFVKELFQNNISFFYGKVVVIKGYNLKCVEVFYGVLLLWYFKDVGNMNQLDIVSFYKQYVQCKKNLYIVYILQFYLN